MIKVLLFALSTIGLILIFFAAQSVDLDDRLRFMKHLVERKLQFPCAILFLRLAQKQVQI